MKVLYQSEITGKTYESKEELFKAEEEISEAKKQEELKRKQRAAAAKSVQEKLEKAKIAQKEAHDALNEFCKTYGSFKTSLSHKEIDSLNPFSLLSLII